MVLFSPAVRCLEKVVAAIYYREILKGRRPNDASKKIATEFRIREKSLQKIVRDVADELSHGRSVIRRPSYALLGYSSNNILIAIDLDSC